MRKTIISKTQQDQKAKKQTEAKVKTKRNGTNQITKTQKRKKFQRKTWKGEKVGTGLGFKNKIRKRIVAAGRKSKQL